MKEEKVNSEKIIDEYIMPADCEKSEQELEQISIEERKSHYTIINFFSLVIIILVAAAVFMLLTGEKRPVKIDNPLTLKTFLSGEYVKNLQESYVKSLPYPYELKNANEKLTYIYGIGNKVEKFKDDNDGLVIISDEEIEKEKISIKKNEEKALNNDSDEQDSEAEETTKKKTTAKKKTETGSQRVNTTTRRTTTAETTTTDETTTLTTTNNNPPNVTIKITVPPSITYDYGDSVAENDEEEN
ncbi:MAG: hypothetical protein K2F81_00790 [Ruminococcus sp.]|nr:hypothetical protein [Ruminococcus sp.]